MKRNILLCVAGMSPQIITETLFALTQQQEPKVRIDEIRVITTLDGRDKVLSTLLDKEKGVFYQFCEDFGIEAASIKFDETCISLFRTRDGQMLEDIRTPEENELAGDQICEIVRELCKDEKDEKGKKVESRRVFASAAGGRKTMSIYLTLAMSLFGRADDSLSHVLVSEGFESNQFFYPPPTPQIITYFNPQTRISREVSTADARIYLAPIPFIRLCGISTENEKFGEARKYGEMVNQAQKTLDIREKEYDLLIDMGNQSVFVRGQLIEFTPRQFFFFYIFAKRRFNGEATTSLHDLLATDFHSALKEILWAKENEDVDWVEIAQFPKYNFAEVMLGQLEFSRSSEKDKIKREKEWQLFRDAFSKVVTLVRSKFEAKGVDNRYFLVSTDDGTASYQLKITPEKIKLIEQK